MNSELPTLNTVKRDGINQSKDVIMWRDNSTDFKDGTFVIDMDFETPLGTFSAFMDNIDDHDEELTVTFYCRDYKLDIFTGRETHYATAKLRAITVLSNYFKNLVTEVNK